MAEINSKTEFVEYEDGAAERVRRAEEKKEEELRQARLTGRMPRKTRKRPRLIQPTFTEPVNGPSVHAQPQVGDPRASPPELAHGETSSNYDGLLKVYVLDDEYETVQEEKV